MYNIYKRNFGKVLVRIRKPEVVFFFFNNISLFYFDVLNHFYLLSILRLLQL